MFLVFLGVLTTWILGPFGIEVRAFVLLVSQTSQADETGGISAQAYCFEESSFDSSSILRALLPGPCASFVWPELSGYGQNSRTEQG